MLCRAIQNVTVKSTDREHGPLGEGIANHCSILAWRAPWTVGKGKKIRQQKMSSPGWKVSSMLPGKRGGKVLIAPERMKLLGKSKDSAQV